MNASFKCANCLLETPISGEGLRHLGCQSCGCGDIAFSVDVTVSPISFKDPGEVFPPVLVKKGENFLGNHPLGCSWMLTFPVENPPVKVAIKSRVKGKGDEGFYSKL